MGLNILEGLSTHASEAQESKSSSALDKANKGQNVDEMLSDDYYELDGDDQSDLKHHKLSNNAAGYNSIPQPRHAANNFVSRKKSKDSSWEMLILKMTTRTKNMKMTLLMKILILT